MTIRGTIMMTRTALPQTRRIAVTTGCALLLAMASASPCRALDAIRTTKGNTINGVIEGMSPQQVTIKPASGEPQSIPLHEIDSIKFNAEPPQLNVARAAARGGRFDEALRSLDKVLADANLAANPHVEQDARFWQAYSASRRALAGQGDLLAAGKQMRDFAQKYKDNYHILEAHEVLGDLLTAIDRPDLAAQHYSMVEKLATSNEALMRARIGGAGSLLAQGKWSEALAAYDAVIALAVDATPSVARQKRIAELGKAVCLAGLDRADEGRQLAEQIIAQANPDQADVLARAYNALGACLRKADKPKDALLAYLHVDVLFAAESVPHAEALKNLSELWSEVGDPARAAEAQETLKSRYANSRWAR
jgi:tetratricopeptide (TPR) repeat protein